MQSRIAIWRPRLEVAALFILVARLVDVTADVINAASWTHGSVGDWVVHLSGYPALLPGLMLLIPVIVLVVTRIVYSWPSGTPSRAALIAAVGTLILGGLAAAFSIGAVITQLTRIPRAVDYATTAPAFVAGASYALGGLITNLVVLVIATRLVGELAPRDPARKPTRPTEPESGPIGDDASES